MATIEAVQEQRLVGVTTLSSARRPGYLTFEMGRLFDNQPGTDMVDLVQRSAAELSTGENATVLPRLGSALATSHDEYAESITGFLAHKPPATQIIIAALTRYINGLATASEFTSDAGSDAPLPHKGLLSWSPTHIELDRHSGRDVLGRSLSPEYRQADDMGQVAIALVQLSGSRELDIRRNGGTWKPLFLPGQVALLRAPGMIESAEDAIPEFRFSKVNGNHNNLTMTVMNRTVESPPTS